jgi:hypothetical protein
LFGGNMKTELISLIAETKRLLRLGWCKSALARDKNNQYVSSYSKEACSWCLSGAITRAYMVLELPWGVSRVLSDKLTEKAKTNWLAHWNDAQESVDDVINLLDLVEKDIQV